MGHLGMVLAGAAWWGVGLGLLGGCAADETGHGGRGDVVEGEGGGVRAGEDEGKKGLEPGVDAGQVRAAELLLGGQVMRRLEWVREMEDGKATMVMELEKVEGGGGEVTVKRRVGREGRTLVLVREDVLRREANGDLVLVRSIDHEERVQVEFEPPMVIAPGVMMVGEVREQRLRMVVRPRQDLKRVRMQGDAVQRVELTAGKGRGELVLTGRMEADLGGTGVDSSTMRKLVAGRGVVEETNVEVAKVLGVPVRKKREEWKEKRRGSRSAPGNVPVSDPGPTLFTSDLGQKKVPDSCRISDKTPLPRPHFRDS
ncbi:MAG: hypothetical protein H7Y88_00020 [Phycisphaerales bacterium]|nr:hypothetical protein [Phycisphaerales bacterium]